MTPAIATRQRIRDLNDAFRAGNLRVPGQWFLTCGVQAQGPEFIQMALAAVRSFSDFTEDNDPYGEHDFGSINLAGQNLFWKIDAYDRDMVHGSEDPRTQPSP
ncbi:DUF3768 domain-containing protein [Phenylobacterium sp.]|uniref:DUF3768 domain-containing protein n=1 Tax=Phenylobacterium sp. TaxID=1871053 RepID=UPI0025FDB570|nr:DUF3768 domain-containing protein [Phenylobacterium sp.]